MLGFGGFGGGEEGHVEAVADAFVVVRAGNISKRDSTGTWAMLAVGTVV